MSVSSTVVRLKDVTKHKKREIYPSHIHYRVPIDPGEEISAVLTVPDGYVYIVPGEIHDIPSGVFKHRCSKDRMLVLPETLIDGTAMTLNYPEPIMVKKYWEGYVTNTSDSVEVFKLRVPILVVKESIIEDLRSEIEIEEKMKETLMEQWKKASPEERIKMMAKTPELLGKEVI